MSQVQEIIARLRASGMSQSEIARKTGIPQPRLSRWEAGDVPAGAEDSLKLLALETEQKQPARAGERSPDAAKADHPAPPQPAPVEAAATFQPGA